MRLLSVVIACATLYLIGCAPSAWTKPGATLAQGDDAYKICEQRTESALPEVELSDFDVEVNLRGRYAGNASLQASLEQTAARAVQTDLERDRTLNTVETIETCMNQDGWTRTSDTR